MLKDDIENIGSSEKELRSFGRTVGIFLLIVGSVLLWLGKGSYPYFLGVGSVLVVLGFLAPKALLPLQRVWMTLALCIGWVMTRVLLSVFFYLVLTPISLLGRISGKKFLDMKAGSEKSYWNKREPLTDLKLHYERQF